MNDFSTKRYVPTSHYWVDLDDTLIQTKEHNIPLWQKAASEVGLPKRSADTWRREWGAEAHLLVQRVYDNGISREKAAEVINTKRQAITGDDKPIPAIPGAVDFLEGVEKHPGVGIVTSRALVETEDPNRFYLVPGKSVFSLLAHRLNQADLGGIHFDFIAASELTNGFHKPDPRVFETPRLMAAGAGKDTRFITYVGDHVGDYQAAEAAGYNFFGVLTGTTTEEEFMAAGLSELAILNSISFLRSREEVFINSLNIAFEGVYNAIARSWSRDTSSDPDNWSEANPAWGQCAVTSSAIQRIFGGQLLRTSVPWPGSERGISHYFNRLPDGTIIDLTRNQFGENPVMPEPSIRSRTKYVLNAELGPVFEKTLERYHTLMRKAGFSNFL